MPAKSINSAKNMMTSSISQHHSYKISLGKEGDDDQDLLSLWLDLSTGLKLGQS